MSLNRYYTLESRPVGELKDTDLGRHEQPIREPADGEVQVRTTWLSIDPTIRIWMSDVPQYLPPIAIGEVIRSIGLGVVEQSGHPAFKVGDRVGGVLGWATHPTLTPEAASLSKIPDELGLPDQRVLSLTSMTSGMTAYFGLLRIAAPKAGETLVVDAAAGAVGSLVGQIAKIKGCRVVGIAGGSEKCRYVTETLGFDACIDYKNEDVGKGLDEHCPDGIDVCFENVGGPIFDAILARMNNHGRVSLCGLIAGYNSLHERAGGPQNFAMILMRRLRVQGFIIMDYVEEFAAAIPELLGWAKEGKLIVREDIREGFDLLPESLRQLLRGEKRGKMLVKLDS